MREIYEQAQEEGVSSIVSWFQVGGGGLISGVATYIRDVAPSMEVVVLEAGGKAVCVLPLTVLSCKNSKKLISLRDGLLFKR